MVQAHDVDVVQLLQGVVVDQAGVPVERGARVAGGLAARRLLRRQLAPALDEAAALLAEPLAEGRRLGQLEAVEQRPAPGGERGRTVTDARQRRGRRRCRWRGGAEAQPVADGAEGRLQSLAAQSRQLAAQVAARAGVVELAPEQRRQAAARDLALCGEHGQQREGAPARQRPLVPGAVAQARRAEELEDKTGRHGGHGPLMTPSASRPAMATIVVAGDGVVQPVSQQRPGWRLAVIGRSGSFSTPRSSSRSTSSTLLPTG